MDGRPLEPFVYHDHGSLVSLSRFSTVGSLMGNLIGGRMAIEGRLARFVYISLYRMHLIAIHGWLKGAGADPGRPGQPHHPAAAQAALAEFRERLGTERRSHGNPWGHRQRLRP